MPVKIPMRDTIGRANPVRLYDFGEKIAENLKEEDAKKRAIHESSGKISGGKLGQPTLWSVLDILGVPRDFDPYLLGKFKRGNDVEARAINFLTGLDVQYIMDISEGKIDNPGWIQLTDKQLLGGEVYLQLKSGYRGGTGFIDLAQRNNGTYIYHEIKSSTKMSYDRVAVSGRYKEVDIEKEIGVPYYHHAEQLSYYALGDDVQHAFLHYFNADDYRLCTFQLNPLDYKEEIDKEIDDIQSVFISKQLPAFEGFLGYHKAYINGTYPEFNRLTSEEATNLLRSAYPDQYQKLMEITL